MHPSEWAKAIYQKRARKEFFRAFIIVAGIAVMLWLAHFIKTGNWFH